MLDRDLALLYGVETRMLKQAVRRNLKRYPEDFMFEMTKEEFTAWTSQFVTSSRGTNNKNVKQVFECLDQLVERKEGQNKRNRIGYKVNQKM